MPADGLTGRLEAIVDRVIAEVDEGVVVLIARAAVAARELAPPTGGRLDAEAMDPRMAGAASDAVSRVGTSPAVRASRRRRNDSAAAAPAPVTTFEPGATEAEADAAEVAVTDGVRRATGEP